MAPGYEIHAGGDYVAHEHRMYESNTMSDLLGLLKREFSFVVIDTPAIFETAAAVRLCSLADDVLLVVEAEKTPWEVAQEAKRVLERANANLLGVVLNKRRFHVPEWLYEKL
jgi:Mrp family chromosome partitioning ATPase